MNKCCVFLLFLVCLAVVPGSVSAISFDDGGKADFDCSVGDEFTVSVPTGWGVKSILVGYSKENMQFIKKDGGIFSDDYKFKALKPGETYITILTGKLDYLYDENCFEVHVNVKE